MTVATTGYTVTVPGDDATTVFDFSFIADDSSTIQVIYTDLSEIQTILGPGDYTLYINPPGVGQLWGVGGTVTYPISGDPIETGTSLTITRTVPYLQTVSISNQGNLYPQAIEQALDLLELQLQQLMAGGSGVTPVNVILTESTTPSLAISEMPDAGTLTSFEYIPVLKNGLNYRVRADLLGGFDANIAFEFLGGAPPGSSEVIGMTSFDVPVAFDADYAGSTGSVLTNPTSTFTANITKNGTNVGTMAISTGGVFTFDSTGSTDYDAGDYMTIVAPSSADATIANIAWTLAGTKT